MRSITDRTEDFVELDEASETAASAERVVSSNVRAEHSWWAGRWMRSLAQVLDANRIADGRAYANAGRVTQLEIQPGLVLPKCRVARMPHTRLIA